MHARALHKSSPLQDHSALARLVDHVQLVSYLSKLNDFIGRLCRAKKQKALQEEGQSALVLSGSESSLSDARVWS